MTDSRFILLDSVDSTNDEARRLHERGEVDGWACVIAREQTKGRGTRGRSWVSPRDAGLYLSLVESRSRERALPTTALYTLAAGVACVEAITRMCGAKVELKPVNDLCALGGKLGGILAESAVETVAAPDRASASAESARATGIVRLVIGVGINLYPAERRVEPGALRPVSLAEIADPHRMRPLSIEGLAQSLVERMRAWIGRLEAGEVEAVQAAWESCRVPGAVFPTLDGYRVRSNDSGSDHPCSVPSRSSVS